MDPSREISNLKEQVQYLIEEKRAALEALELAGAFGSIATSLNKLESPLPILKETNRKIRTIIQFQATGFFLVDEPSADFQLALCDPENMAPRLKEECDSLVNDLTFAWVLSRNRPHIMRANLGGGHLLMHSLSTSSRTRGMFMGLLGQDKDAILDVHLSLSTVIFLASAHALESFELYSRNRVANAQLTRNLERLERSERDLRSHRRRLEETVAERTIELTTANEQLLKEIEERKRAEATLARQLDYERALSACSKALLAGADEAQALQEALTALVRATQAQTIRVWENVTDERDGLCMHAIAEAPPKRNPTPPPDDLTPYEPGFSRWAEILGQGGIIQGTAREFPPVESILLRSRGVGSLLALPVMADDQWLGYLAFEDQEENRVFSTEQIALLQTAAEMIGSFLKRQGMLASLKRAKYSADQANMAKTLFLANVSHELRTPLHGIIGMTQLLDETYMNEEQRQFLRLVADSSRQLLSVINDLLDLSRLEARSLELSSLPFLVRKTITPLLDTYAAKARAKGLDFTIQITDAVPEKLVGDPFRLSQMVANLASNAVKFTPQGTVHVRVDLHRPSQGEYGDTDAELRLEVRDTGVGISQDKLGAIFDSFSLGEDFMTKRHGGTGMGLAITRQLAEMMHGSLHVSSEVGVGSVFRLTVRLKALKGEDAGQDETRPDATRGSSVLLADDEKVHRLYVRKALTDLGCTVHTAEDMDEALRLLCTEDLDMVLLTLDMPHLNALELVQAIRGGQVEDLNPDLAVICITGQGDAMELGEVCLANGVAEILTKPVKRDALARIAKGPGRERG